MTAEIEGFIREAAIMRGISGDIAIRVARSEGGVDEYAKRGTFATGSSFWAFQLHYGGIGTPYEYLGTVAGMGNGFTKLTGWQPGAEAAWRDSTRYGLNRAKASGWSAWYGAAHVGVGQWEGIDTSHPWDANAEVWDYEQGAPSDLVYNQSQPPERQIQGWTCSIRSTAWALKSLGLPVDIGALQDEMVPRYVTPDLGLLDGSGSGLAEVLRAHLPSTWAERVHVFERIDWASLWSHAGTGPMCVGLHGAYHWINVAAPQSDGHLTAPNPAPKYPAAAPIGDVLTHDELGLYGPASAVWVDAAPRVIEPPAPSVAYSVGPGILDAMTASGDVPGSDELFFKAGDRDAWSEATALSGARYLYLPSAGRTFCYPST
jgi:hypothetical protein